jgi:hypothetical protein
MITPQIVQRLIEAPLVVADLSGRNPNVFYELAIRHVVHKPLIQMITKGEPIPFHVSTSRTIYYDLTDLETVDQAKLELTKQIGSLESSRINADNPVSMSISLKGLRDSRSPQQQSLARILEGLGELRNEVMVMRRELDSVRKPPEQADSMIRSLDEQRSQAQVELVVLSNLLADRSLHMSKRETREIEERKRSLESQLREIQSNRS